MSIEFISDSKNCEELRNEFVLFLRNHQKRYERRAQSPDFGVNARKSAQEKADSYKDDADFWEKVRFKPE